MSGPPNENSPFIYQNDIDPAEMAYLALQTRIQIGI